MLSTGVATSLIADGIFGTAFSNAWTGRVDAVTDCVDETLLTTDDTLGATFSGAWGSGVDAILDCTGMTLWTADEILAAAFSNAWTTADDATARTDATDVGCEVTTTGEGVSACSCSVVLESGPEY